MSEETIQESEATQILSHSRIDGGARPVGVVENGEVVYDIVEYNRAMLIDTLHRWSRYVNGWAKGKGFWPEDVNARNKPEQIMLMVTELAEACEALRKQPKPDEHCPEFSNLEVELADTIIRILDFSGAYGIRLGEAIVAKMKFNETRPHKHGKAF